MTIKKTLSVKRPAPAAADAEATPTTVSAAPAATIADRFKLDAPPPDKSVLVDRTAAMWAFTAGLIALVVAGALTYILWQHWEFLMPA